MMTALLLAVCAQAQVLRTAPRNETPKSLNRMALKAITPTGDQMWWGYYFGDKGWNPVGTGSAGTFDCAIRVPANHKYVGPSTIKAIRFYLSTASNVSMAKVWVSRSLPSDVDAADYVQNVELSSLEDGPNEISLNTPFKVDNQNIYVGYSFTIKSAEYCIVQGGSYVANSLYLRSTSASEWGTISYLGCLGLHLLIEGGSYPSSEALPADFGSAVAIIGSGYGLLLPSWRHSLSGAFPRR